MTFRVDILTLFPGFFSSPFSESIMKRAEEAGHVTFACTDIREFSNNKHRTVDDVPFGGGAGMVMKVEPLVLTTEHVEALNPGAPRILMTPQGEPFSQKIAQELSEGPGMILTCGHYEGVDERFREGWIDREISIGDYVLTGGEPAALVVVDAVVRLLEGVLGNNASLDDESFSSGLLEYPHYTRPREFRGVGIPEVLLSGHHAKIAKWRHDVALERTRERRPDLLAAYNKEDK